QERAVARHAHDVRDLRSVQRRPIESGKDACEWAGKVGHGIGHDWERGVREARGIAVGVEDDAGALRLDRCEHAREDGPVADADAGLGAAAHPARQTARQNEADRWSYSAHFESPANGFPVAFSTAVRSSRSTS